MSKLALPEVTLLITETRQHELANLALRDSLEDISFGDVVVCTDNPQWFGQFDARIVAVPNWPSKQQWCAHNMYGIAPHLRTSHVLSLQWDSWVTYPECWDRAWLAYDYIGGPWSYTDGMNVGDGGFCLRSTALLRYLRKHRDRFPCVSELDDDLVCRTYRRELQDAGFEWCPELIAHRFSSRVSRNLDARIFGFHSLPSFWYGCGGDIKRFAERIRIMARSDYITHGARKALWDDFREQNPEVDQILLQMEAAE